MYVRPDIKEMSQILTEDEIGSESLEGIDAIKLTSDQKQYLEEIREQLKTLGYKEVKVG